MKPAFIITSAINTNVGVYSPEARIMQTHATIDSILREYPDALTVLVEGGKAIPETTPLGQQFNVLKNRVNVTLNMASNAQIIHLHEQFFDQIKTKNEMGGTTGLSKTVGELTLFAATLDAIRNNEQCAPILECDRVFKISGRYQLSPLFNKDVYVDPSNLDKFIFRQADKSWMGDALEKIGVEYGFASRLWSFPTSRIDETIEKFTDMIQDCVQVSLNSYIDIEHLLYKFFNGDNVTQLDHTHLMGTIAPNGVMVYD